MSPGMQLRLWFKEASLSQRVVTVGVSGLVVALVAFSVVPEGSDGQSLVADSGIGGPGGPGGPGGSQPLGMPGSTVSPGQTGFPGTGTGSTQPGGGFGRPSGGAVQPGTGYVPGGGGSSTGPSQGPPVPLTASDVGITAKQINVGFTIINLAGVNAAGGAVGLRKDAPQAVQAYVDEVNAHGGVDGRRVVASVRRIDIISESDQNAACTWFAHDAKAFGIVDSANFLYESSQSCVVRKEKMPLVHTYALTEGFQAAAQGRDITVSRNLNRVAREWVQAAKDQGFLKGGEVVGIMAHECDSVIKDDLVPALNRGKAVPKKIVIEYNGCTPNTANQGITQAVLDMYNKGVTHVFLAIGGGVTGRAFTDAAEAQRGVHPRFKYFASEYNGLSDPGQTKDFNPNQWDGVKGVVANFHGYVEAGKKPLPAVKRCSDILVKHGLRRADAMTAGDQEVLVLCDHFNIMVNALRMAGPNPTRQSWAYWAQRIGTFQSVLDPFNSLRPGKFSAADGIADIHWYRDCRCYKQTSAYRMGKF